MDKVKWFYISNLSDRLRVFNGSADPEDRFENKQPHNP